LAKKLAAIGAVLAALALTLSMLAPALADNRGDKVTLHFAEKFADDDEFITEVDVPPSGFSVGDYLVFEGEPIFNVARTRQVGEVTGDCLVVKLADTPEDTTFECDLTYDLPKGLILTEGPFIFSRARQDWAVTGGTEAYRTAHGTLTLIFEDEGFRFRFELFL
jgi:hypothetical protein